MTFEPQTALLDDGRRLHLQHGPIDLVIEAFGPTHEVHHAYKLATKRFKTILDELVKELPLLRSPVSQGSTIPKGQIARQMREAVLPFAPRFITPMAAVAGSVADEILRTLRQADGLHKIYVNNGGDIALFIQPSTNHTFKIGVVSNPDTGRLITTANITPNQNIGGVATSGWHGRSHSLGIADCVTVFAKTAAQADAAATMIANQITLSDCHQIARQPASQLSPDSDLGEQLITTNIGKLTSIEVSAALNAGEQTAQNFFKQGLFEAAFLSLNEQQRIVGWTEHPAILNPPPISLNKPIDRISHA